MLSLFHNLANGIILIGVGLLILGILVLIHELGHFLVAKAFKIKVLAFSIGFGKALFKKTIGETEYRISVVPFGGYVNMAGEHPEEKPVPEPGDFNTKPIWQRALVAIAGPVANYVFAMICLYFVFIFGIKTPQHLMKPVVGYVENNSSAFNAGFLSGDSIISINGKIISGWEDIYKEISLKRNNDIVVSRNGKILQLKLTMEEHKTARLPKKPAGGIYPALPPVIGRVVEESPAMQAGFKSNDTIISINNEKINTWDQLTLNIINYDSLKGPLIVGVKRGDSIITLNVKPKYNQTDKRFQIGIGVSEPSKIRISYGPIKSVEKMLQKTWEYTIMIYDVLAKLASKEVSPKQLAGPVGIVQMTGIVALGGPVELLNLMALIGINLAVLNLLPLIITDGGLLLFLLIEAIRRKPLPVKYQLIINRFAIAFFILLFAYVTYNDILRLPDLLKMMLQR
jgi:regulator of sigma E protease